MKYTRICAFCSKEFTAYKSSTRYCSGQCSKRAYKERKRAENRREVVARDRRRIVSAYTNKEIVSIGEATCYLGVSRSTMFRYIRSGLIPSMKLGRAVRLRRTDLDLLFERKLPYSREERIVRIAESNTSSDELLEGASLITDRYISRKQACEMLGICNATAWKLFKKE